MHLGMSLGAGTFCRDFTEKKSPQCRGFLQGFYRKEVPAVLGLYLGFANGKVNIPAISRPRGGRGNWLQMTGALMIDPGLF